MDKIKYIQPENLSGNNTKGLSKVVATIKKRDLIVVKDFSVGGDAPKDFIKIYHYGSYKRKNRHKWTKYIAKTGHKWYPTESIMEHLLNCVGQELGLLMSESRLAFISGQLRFLSTYFLDNQQQELVHGIDIFAGFVSDRAFVEQIEAQQLARAFFTFQFTAKAIEFAFPKNSTDIITDFVKLLVFDAVVGNNDRHFYNWGVVKSIKNKHKPYFSPIFDTARGLFWNDSEQKIVDRISNKGQLDLYLQKYIKRSFPKIGWEGQDNLNHFQLVEKIKNEHTQYHAIIEDLVSVKKEESILEMIDSKFSKLLSVNRLFIIKTCLKLRFQYLRNIK